MKPSTLAILFISGFVALFIFHSFHSCAKSKATKAYVDNCMSVIHAASKEAEKVWLTRNKNSLMEDAFLEASRIDPKDADEKTVILMRRMLKEGREYYSTKDGEETWLRDFLLVLACAWIDASGGRGIASTTRVALKKAEIKSDEKEKLEFVSALEELVRYLEHYNRTSRFIQAAFSGWLIEDVWPDPEKVDALKVGF